MSDVKKQLDKLYAGPVKPFKEGKKAAHFTYGEITRKGAETLMEKFAPYFENTDGVFYDMGCGFGRLISHVALRTKMKKIQGFEFDPERAKWGRENINNINFPEASPEIIIGDMFKQDMSDATIVYFDNTMYPERILELSKVLPKGCLLIYKAGGHQTGDCFFSLETTYNCSDKKRSLSALAEFWYKRASWRII